MHLNTKRLAFLSLLLAVTVLLVILSGVLEFNTLFLLAAASFCVGIAIRESNLRYGVGFYIAAVLLSLILAPNKFYCITFSAMGLYIIVAEFSYDKMLLIKSVKNRKMILWLIKYVTFNAMYLAILLILPSLIYSGNIKPEILAVLILVGQIVLYVYDRAYYYVQKDIWSRARIRFKL